MGQNPALSLRFIQRKAIEVTQPLDFSYVM